MIASDSGTPIDDLPDARVVAALALAKRLRNASGVGVISLPFKQAAHDLAAAGIAVVASSTGNLVPVDVLHVRRDPARRFGGKS